LQSANSLILPFIQAADKDAASKIDDRGLTVKGGAPRTALVEYHPPEKLSALLNLGLPNEGTGKEGMLDLIQKILQYSVNTWDQGLSLLLLPSDPLLNLLVGFMDKLYSSTNPVGVVSELLLAVLNTNVIPTSPHISNIPG
jgi:hypothetical protein